MNRGSHSDAASGPRSRPSGRAAEDGVSPVPASIAIADLIAKLEAATEGCPFLDVAIMRAVYPRATMAAGEWFLSGIKVRVEPYTTSLDAALTLVPEGWTPWDLIARHTTPAQFDADPALALCIAALKTRASLSDPHTDTKT
jgi:hypothetical protein